MARSETAARGLVIYVTSNLFTTSSTPGTARTATSISRRRSAPRASPCSVTTKEQELMLIRGSPRERGPRPAHELNKQRVVRRCPVVEFSASHATLPDGA
jgi:hypothetical protein